MLSNEMRVIEHLEKQVTLTFGCIYLSIAYLCFSVSFFVPFCFHFLMNFSIF